MECQTAECVALYARRDSPGEPLPINMPRIDIADHTPSDGEIREAARELSNGRAGGASGMHAEDVKTWLHGIKLEEDPRTRPTNENTGDHWEYPPTASLDYCHLNPKRERQLSWDWPLGAYVEGMRAYHGQVPERD